MNIPIGHYLIFSAIIFVLGIYGLLTRRNLIALLISIELVLNAAAFNFAVFHCFMHGGDPAGTVFTLIIIAIAAAEAATLLAIAVVITKQRRELDTEKLASLKN